MKQSDIDQIIKALDSSVEAATKKYVNGKIDRLQESLDRHIDDDSRWKEKANELLGVVSNARGFTKTVLFITSFIAAIWGTVQIFKK